jgi:hypothetical protein
MSSLGFRFDDNFLIGNENYPFVEVVKNHFQSNSKIKIINPLAPLMRKDSASRSVYYLNDEHLSPAGQAVVKGQVLESMGMLTGERK